MESKKIEMAILGLDDLGRAIEHAEERLKLKSSEFLKSHIAGLRLTQKKIEEGLGIEAFHAKYGDKFDVNLMHAMTRVCDKRRILPENSVAYQISAGYKSKENGKVIRFAGVVVSHWPIG